MLELVVALAFSGAGCGYEGAVYAEGRAVDPASGELVYCEYHLPAADDGRRVLYYSAAGHRIAEKTLRGIDSSLPEVKQNDFRHGEQRKITRAGTQLSLQYRESGKAALESERLPLREVEVADAGFDHFVREHWGDLVAGEPVRFDFASPVHGRAIALRAQQSPCPQGQSDTLCLRVEPAAALLRLFAGELNLVYSLGTRRLQVFEGVVNLLDDRGDNQTLRIRYRYP